MGRVLVVDDEQGIRDVLDVLISSKGHFVLTAKSVEEAAQVIESESFFDLVITDLRLDPGGDGMDVVRLARSSGPNPPEVIVMTAYGTREKERAGYEQGATFYLEKGPHFATDIEVLVAQAISRRQLQEENENLRRALVKRYSLGEIVGKSNAMQEVFDLIERIASTRATVLISGESGTGKERVAKSLHFGSNKREGPFIPLNCGAVPENLIESELFGHERGAFTGADSNKQGLFAAARGGTIFLDEIGELPLALQPKLLRVLQERKIKPLGAVNEVDVDVRVIAASNRDLEQEVREGRFREDLYFRLNVVQIDLPPLRRRLEDIPLLASTFLDKFSKEYDRPVTQIAPEGMEQLLHFDYPGNVRQLENIIERGVALASSGTLQLEQLPQEVREAGSRPTRVFILEGEAPFPEEGVDLDRLVGDFEYRLICRALDVAEGVKTKAAELLGLSLRQFRYKLSKYERQRDATGTASGNNGR